MSEETRSYLGAVSLVRFFADKEMNKYFLNHDTPGWSLWLRHSPSVLWNVMPNKVEASLEILRLRSG